MDATVSHRGQWRCLLVDHSETRTCILSMSRHKLPCSRHIPSLDTAGNAPGCNVLEQRCGERPVPGPQGCFSDLHLMRFSWPPYTVTSSAHSWLWSSWAEGQPLPLWGLGTHTGLLPGERWTGDPVHWLIPAEQHLRGQLCKNRSRFELDVRKFRSIQHLTFAVTTCLITASRSCHYSYNAHLLLKCG